MTSPTPVARRNAIPSEERPLIGTFESFYRSEYNHMVAMARALAPDRQAAEDLAQESFATAHRHWARVSRYDNPSAWVRRVMVNRATSMRRRIGAEIRAISKIGHDPDRGTVTDLSPDSTEVWEEVRRLPKRQQQAVVLHYVGQLSTDEIGAVMGCSGGTVKAHLHQAREHLRVQLTDTSQE